MKNLFLIFFLSVFSYTYATPTDDKETDVIIKMDEGTVNITTKVILITASGTPGINISNINTARIDAEKTAEKNLAVRLEKALSKLILENGASLGKYLSEKKDTGFFKGLIKDEDRGEKVSSKYYSDGSVDLQYRVPIGKFLDHIRLKTMPDICKGDKTQISFPETPVGTPDEGRDALVIEIGKGKLDPALYLKIENEKGELIYSSCIFGSVPSMMIMKDPGRFLEALNSKENFMTVPSLRVKNGSTVVIRNADAEKIANEMKKSSLKEGKVIFLIKK
jgi:hypothetical protein